MSKGKLKKGIALIVVCTMLFGTTTAYAGENAWREWRTPEDYNHVSKDSRVGKDDSWEVRTQIKFNCDGMEYACMATMGFSDGVFSDTDYINQVGGVSAGMKCGGRVFNASCEGAETGWIYDAKLSGKASVKNTGDNVDFKFTVATLGY